MAIEKLICKICKKKFMANFNRFYCSEDCRNEVIRRARIKNRKEKPLNQFICKHCKDNFYSEQKIKYFCSNECEKRFNNLQQMINPKIKDYNYQKKNRHKINLKLKMAATECYDPVNRKLKVMRG